MIVSIRLAVPAIAVFLSAYLALAVHLESAAMAYDGKTVTVTQKDSGSKIKLGKGDILIVRLEAQAGTAYRWTIAKNNADVLKAPAKPMNDDPDKPGGKFTQTFRFDALTVGTSVLELQYARSFDKDKAAAKIFKLNVTVE